MGKLTTLLENGTDSPFEVRSESSSGVHALLTTIQPQGSYTLVRSSSDTYLQHWVVMGDAPVVSFSSDELIDNDKITIVCEGAEYRKVVVARNAPKNHTPKSNSMPIRRPHPIGAESPNQTPNAAGKPPTSGLRRFFSTFIRVRSASPEAASPPSTESSTKSVDSS